MAVLHRFYCSLASSEDPDEMLHKVAETTVDRDVLLMLAVLDNLVLVLGFLIVDNWVAWPDQTGVVKCINKCPDRAATTTDSWPRGYKTFFMLN